MKCISKSNKGFTLVEVVLVIAIIVILASVMVFAVSGYLSKADEVKQAVSSDNESFSNQNENINDNFVDLGY